MIVDARTLPSGQELATDVCVVGSGPAGMTVARELADTGRRICLLESGGIDFDEEVQRLSEGAVTGDPFVPLTDLRRRQVGGNSNVWTMRLDGALLVRYAPLDRIDFESRDWIPHSGWPFTREHLDPYYERAQAICRIGPYRYDAEAWQSDEGGALALDENLCSSVFQFGARSVFCDSIRGELERAERVTILHNGTALRLETDDRASRVTLVRAGCLTGTRFGIRAGHVVLAAGGLENPKLLLSSDRAREHGLGNEHDLVGRFFMDHPLVDSGTLVPAQKSFIDRVRLYDAHRANGTVVMGKLGFTQEAMHANELHNLSVVLLPRSRAIESLKAVVRTARRGAFPANAASELASVAAGLDVIVTEAYRKLARQPRFVADIDVGGWTTLPYGKRRFTELQVLHQTEQVPSPDNRVTLDDERDALGQRRVRLSWRWGDADIASICRAQNLLARAVAHSGIGRFDVLRDDDGRPQLLKPSTAHHIGTTRMHADPRHGVVDPNCRVHGISNLYVAGSSVFPTGGYANPTLTIVALAVRLADHLKKAPPGS